VIDPQHEQQAVLTESAAAPVAAPSDSGVEVLASDTEVSFKQLGQWELVWRRFKRHHLAMFGAVMLVLLSLMAIFAPLISPESYLGYNYLVSNIQPRLTIPGAKDWVYIMGSDVQGHSLLMWVTYGARISLMVGLVSAVLSSVIGIVMGATAGYFGGWADAIVMRITDVFLTLPFLPLIIMLSYERDLSCKEIMEVMQKPSVTAVTTHLYKAMKKLRALVLAGEGTGKAAAGVPGDDR